MRRWLLLAAAAGPVLWCAQATAQPLPSNDELAVRAPTPEQPPGQLGPQAVRPYREGVPVPAGFHVESSFHTALLASGAALLVSGYGLAAVAARAELDLGSAEGGPPNHGPLYAPLIGPFIAAAGDGWSGGGRAAFIADGLVQAGGMALMMLGLVERELYVVADRPAAARVWLRAGPAAASVGVSF